MNSFATRDQSQNLIDKAYSMLSPCQVCPRMCGVDRLSDETYGECRTGLDPMISSANLHFGEEPPISGFNGSGAIFFANCNLSCKFCQNYPISQYGEGQKITPDDLAKTLLKLQKRGAHNINFVTPTHLVPQIIRAFFLAKEDEFRLPLVYNSSGYDNVETLKLLDGIIDIYMPDMRYNDSQVSAKLSRASNYPEINRAAVREMHRQVGNLQMNDEGIATRGLLIRHLILPKGYAGSEEIFKFIAEEISQDTYVSIMSQYFPAYQAVDDPELNRKITRKEFRSALEAFHHAGLSEGFIQPEPL